MKRAEDWGNKWLIDFSGGKTQLVSSDHLAKYRAIDMEINGSVPYEKWSFQILRLSISSKLNWGTKFSHLLKLPLGCLYLEDRSVSIVAFRSSLYFHIFQCFTFVWVQSPRPDSSSTSAPVLMLVGWSYINHVCIKGGAIPLVSVRSSSTNWQFHSLHGCALPRS